MMCGDLDQGAEALLSLIHGYWALDIQGDGYLLGAFPRRRKKARVYKGFDRSPPLIGRLDTNWLC